MSVYESILFNLVRALDELNEIVDPLSKSTRLGKSAAAFIRLKYWTAKHRDAMDFTVFEEIQSMVKDCKDERSELDVDLIKSMLEDTNGIDLISHAEEVAGMPPSWDTSFASFEDCEKKIAQVRRSIAKHEPGKDKGYVYVLINKSMPGLVKIGVTYRDPSDRLQELSTHTGVPTPFNLTFEKWVSNCTLVEELTHKKLNANRVSSDREFFRTSREEAIDAIEAVIREIHTRKSS